RVMRRAPFIDPHHSVTRAALLGGGSGNPRPGAVSLAHHGVLFLDEVSEVPAAILDGLRTPLEDGQIRLLRAHREVVFPARFQLVLAANPCRCATEDPARCRCRSQDRAAYLRNLSGPMRDRLDITARTSAAGVLAGEVESSAVIAGRVAEARERARARFGCVNAAMDPHRLRREHPADEAGMSTLGSLLATGDITQRGVDRALKLAWTLADLDAAAQPDLDHVLRAAELREGV
ncbi:ATP-binding protein, partial [Corynebacterium nasicanis]